MDTVLSKPAARATSAPGVLNEIRAAEWVILAFFVYLAASALVRQVSFPRVALLIIAPIALVQIWRFESNRTCVWSRVLRDWLTLALIPIGYWAVGWFAAGRHHAWELTWVSWDRALLDQIGLRAAIESTGIVFPALLETLYLLLYAFPPICLGLLYPWTNRAGIHRFLLILFLGTFTAYALLPVFPVESPRLVFHGTDSPNIESPARHINTWLLDHLDIATSVFPSGHVAVAFSCAFGLFSVLRPKRVIWGTAFVAAVIVYLATIYGRYHYSVDGLASIIIALMSWLVIESMPAVN